MLLEEVVKEVVKEVEKAQLKKPHGCQWEIKVEEQWWKTILQQESLSEFVIQLEDAGYVVEDVLPSNGYWTISTSESVHSPCTSTDYEEDSQEECGFIE